AFLKKIRKNKLCPYTVVADHRTARYTEKAAEPKEDFTCPPPNHTAVRRKSLGWERRSWTAKCGRHSGPRTTASLSPSTSEPTTTNSTRMTTRRSPGCASAARQPRFGSGGLASPRRTG